MSTIIKGLVLFVCLFSLVSSSYACPQCERDRAAAAADSDEIQAYIQNRVQNEVDY